MPMCARVVCVLTLLATPAAAQPTREDGIRAMVDGDYRAAVRILRPLADDAARPDPVAQFLLAILYDTGHGGDSLRACGLFLRAATPANPFMEQSSAIAALMREEHGSWASLLCVADERWQGGPPQSVVLAPGHRIVFADTSITTEYDGREQRTSLLLPVGVAYLPIQYTPVAVTRPVTARRHFLQWFGWTPDTTLNPSSWTLGWTLLEVVGADLFFMTSEKRLAIVSGRTPPASYGLDDLVRLQVNASGEAEVTIAGGSSPRTEVIPWPVSR